MSSTKQLKLLTLSNHNSCVHNFLVFWVTRGEYIKPYCWIPRCSGHCWEESRVIWLASELAGSSFFGVCFVGFFFLSWNAIFTWKLWLFRLENLADNFLKLSKGSLSLPKKTNGSICCQSWIWSSQVKFRIWEKLLSTTALLTASHYLKFSEEIRDDINGGDFFLSYNATCQHLEDLHNFCEPACSRMIDACYHTNMHAWKIHSKCQVGQWILI